VAFPNHNDIFSLTEHYFLNSHNFANAAIKLTQIPQNSDSANFKQIAKRHLLIAAGQKSIALQFLLNFPLSLNIYFFLLACSPQHNKG